MGVDNVRAAVAVAGQMDLAHPIDRNAFDKLQGIEAVVEGAHVDVVHVQQHMAVRATRDFGQEIPFAHRGVAKGHITGHVLQQNLPAQEILHLTYPGGDVIQRLLGVGYGKQVVQISAGNPGPAQMIGHPGRLDALRQLFQCFQVVTIQRVGAADRQRHSVQHHGIFGTNSIQKVKGFAAGYEVVFAQGLEPVHTRTNIEYRLVVVGAQAKPESQGRVRCHSGVILVI